MKSSFCLAPNLQIHRSEIARKPAKENQQTRAGDNFCAVAGCGWQHQPKSSPNRDPNRFTAFICRKDGTKAEEERRSGGFLVVNKLDFLSQVFYHFWVNYIVTEIFLCLCDKSPQKCFFPRPFQPSSGWRISLEMGLRREIDSHRPS